MVTFVKSVEVKGHILDCMIESNVFGFERRKEIDGILSREDRIRALLENVIETEHPTSGQVFVDALKEEYKWLADKIQKELDIFMQQNCAELHESQTKIPDVDSPKTSNGQSHFPKSPSTGNLIKSMMINKLETFIIATKYKL